MEHKKHKIVLIANSNGIDKWQYDALLECADICIFDKILICQNTLIKRNYLAHFFYYILNFLCIHHVSRQRYFVNNLFDQEIPFFSEKGDKDGWQSLPDSIIDTINQADFCVRFGMSLLSIPNWLKTPVLSFHHGDPRKYRGRPSGFYEILNKESTVGIVVQSLNNRLDSGAVRAFGESKVFPHSYGKTIRDLYRNSRFLLRKAIEFDIEITMINHSSGVGTNFKLPSNLLVIKFLWQIFRKKIIRGFELVFVHKIWSVAVYKKSQFFKADLKDILKCSSFIKTPSDFLFLADPSFRSDDEILVEGLSKKKGIGCIASFNLAGELLTGIFDRGHCSYPTVVDFYKKRPFLIIENSVRPGLIAREIRGNGIVAEHQLRGFENIMVVDPTFHICERTGTVFVFFNSLDNTDELLLFYARDLGGEFLAHRDSPVCVSPRGGRMGGLIWRTDEGYFRFGQNNSSKYGNGIIVFKIDELSVDRYTEIEVDSISFNEIGLGGPHTLNAWDGQWTFDVYQEETSFMAFVYRVKNVLNRCDGLSRSN